MAKPTIVSLKSQNNSLMAIFITDKEHSTYLRQQIDDCGETSKGFNTFHNNDLGSDIVGTDYPPLGQSSQT